MNKNLVTLILTAFSFGAHAQGTIEFANIQDGVVNAPIYESDRTTPLSGPQFLAGLLVGPSASSLASVATTGFLTGTSSGYFNGGAQTINNISTGNTAWIHVQVWNTSSGSSFLQAKSSGLPNSWWQSAVFTVTLGGGTINPTPPAPLTGLGTSPVYLNSIPEPSTFALAGLGAAVVLLRSRRPNVRRRNCRLICRLKGSGLDFDPESSPERRIFEI